MELTAIAAATELATTSFTDWAANDIPPMNPGVVLAALVTHSSYASLRSFAEAAGVAAPHLSQLIQSQRRITAEIAWRIGKALDIAPNALLRLQSDYDLWEVHRGAEL